MTSARQLGRAPPRKKPVTSRQMNRLVAPWASAVAACAGAEEMAVDGVPADLGAPIAVAPGRHKLEFTYTALSYLVPEKVRFKTWLPEAEASMFAYVLETNGDLGLNAPITITGTTGDVTLQANDPVGQERC